MTITITNLIDIFLEQPILMLFENFTVIEKLRVKDQVYHPTDFEMMNFSFLIYV